jgi:hypothetical protein
MELEDITAGIVGILMIFFIRYVFAFWGNEDISAEPEHFQEPESIEYLAPDRSTVYQNQEAVTDNLAGQNYDELTLIKKIADSVGYAWAANGARFHFGCPENADCSCQPSKCLMGEIRWVDGRNIFDIWITENAFKNEQILKFTIFHEMAHVWQIRMRGANDRWEDFSRWNFNGIDPMEATADCLASAWGGEGHIYYDCPLDAQRYIHQLYLESLR